MPDVFSKAKRSEVMSLIRSRGNKDTEQRLAALFRTHRITGWRRHVTLSFPARAGSTTPPSRARVRPDFIFRHARLALFVDGCFWHGCPLHFRRPASRQPFWDAKIARNQARDTSVTRGLRRAGWRVLRLWEHELTRANEKRILARLRRALTR